MTADTYIPQLFRKSRKQAMGARKMYHFSAEVEWLKKTNKKEESKRMGAAKGEKERTR